MNGLLGMTSQVALIHFVRFVNFLDGFLNMLLCLSKIRMRCGINIAGALRENHTSKDRANCETCGEKNVAMFHASVSLYLRGSGMPAASSRFSGIKGSLEKHDNQKIRYLQAAGCTRAHTYVTHYEHTLYKSSPDK